MKFAEVPLDQSYEQWSAKQKANTQARYRYATNVVGDRSVKWLDIGTNRGFGLEVLDSCNRDVTAIDLSTKYLHDAKENHLSNATVIAMDTTALGFNKETFDVVTAFEVIEHLYDEEQFRMLKEIYRVITPEGRLFLSTPNIKASGKRLTSPDHKMEFELEDLKALLHEYGFSICGEYGQSFFKKGNLVHDAFRIGRENPAVVFLYNRVLPWSVRAPIRDFLLTTQSTDQVRQVGENETPRNIYLVCKKDT